MFHKRFDQIFLFFLILLSFAVPKPALAQELCEVLVRDVWEQVKENCQSTGNFNACYGNDSLIASFQTEIDGGVFSQSGDQIELPIMNSIHTLPFDEEAEEWGVSYFRIGADAFGGNPDENVIFFITGDVIIENMIGLDGGISFQDFNFKTASDSECKEAPNAVFIQAPEGLEVDLVVNSTPIRIGSTVVLRTQDNADGSQEMWFAVLEGSLITYPDTEYEVIVEPGQVLRTSLYEWEEEPAADLFTGEALLGPYDEPFYRQAVEDYIDLQWIVPGGEGFWGWEAYTYTLFIPAELLNYSLISSNTPILAELVQAAPPGLELPEGVELYEPSTTDHGEAATTDTGAPTDENSVDEGASAAEETDGEDSAQQQQQQQQQLQLPIELPPLDPDN